MELLRRSHADGKSSSHALIFENENEIESEKKTAYKSILLV